METKMGEVGDSRRLQARARARPRPHPRRAGVNSGSASSEAGDVVEVVVVGLDADVDKVAHLGLVAPLEASAPRGPGAPRPPPRWGDISTRASATTQRFQRTRAIATRGRPTVDEDGRADDAVPAPGGQGLGFEQDVAERGDEPAVAVVVASPVATVDDGDGDGGRGVPRRT